MTPPLPTGPADLVPVGQATLLGNVVEFDEPRGIGVVRCGDRTVPVPLHRHHRRLPDRSRSGRRWPCAIAAGRLGRLEARSVRPLPGACRTRTPTGPAEPGGVADRGRCRRDRQRAHRGGHRARWSAGRRVGRRTGPASSWRPRRPPVARLAPVVGAGDRRRRPHAGRRRRTRRPDDRTGAVGPGRPDRRRRRPSPCPAVCDRPGWSWADRCRPPPCRHRSPHRAGRRPVGPSRGRGRLVAPARLLVAVLEVAGRTAADLVDPGHPEGAPRRRVLSGAGRRGGRTVVERPCRTGCPGCCGPCRPPRRCRRPPRSPRRAGARPAGRSRCPVSAIDSAWTTAHSHSRLTMSGLVDPAPGTSASS